MKKANFIEPLRGKRTYLISVSFVVIGVGGWLIGAIETSQALELVLEGLGFSGLRAAFRK